MIDRLLVTGGSGFIGAELVELALGRGMALRNIDVAAPRDAAHRPMWRQFDIRNRDSLTREIVEFDPHYVVHLASDIDIEIRQIEKLTTTIEGTANILAALAEAPSLRGFLHTSTQFVVTPGIRPDNERDLRPYTVYGAAKAEAERMVWAADLAVPWIIARPVVVWGPHHPSFAREIFRHMRSRCYLHPTSKPPIERAYGYVTNVAHQMFALVTLPPGPTGRRVFYLGDEIVDYDGWADSFSRGLSGRAARRVPVWLLSALGKAGDAAIALGMRPPIDSGRVLRMSTTSNLDLRPTYELAGAPPVDFETGLRRTLRWLEAERAAGKSGR